MNVKVSFKRENVLDYVHITLKILKAFLQNYRTFSVTSRDSPTFVAVVYWKYESKAGKGDYQYNRKASFVNSS